MLTKSNSSGAVPSHLFKPLLLDIVSKRHAMVKLADAIDWQSFEDGLRECFCADTGRLSCSVRLMIAFGTYFEHEYPTDQSTMSRWRKKLAKIGFVTSSKSNWIVGAEAYPGNPYDGHILKSALAQTTKIFGFESEMAICDLGYRGNNNEEECNIQVVNRFRKRVSRSLCSWWNRRSAIEPVIGHCKSEHRMDRNQLRGKLDDELNVIFAVGGFNFRKLLRAFSPIFVSIFQIRIFAIGLPIEKMLSEKV